jgi:Uma2 family endonuclease
VPFSTPAAYADYLALDERAAERHEWIRGEVHAMAGGTPEHAALAAAFILQLGAVLRNRPCRVFSSDLRVRSEVTDFSGYPDVTVVCGKLETPPGDPRSAANPIVVVEVLSDTTEARDRGEKFAHYRLIPSLREIVFVSQAARRVEVHRKNAAGRWELYEFGPGQRAELASVEAEISVDELYRDPLAGAAG